MNKNIIKIKELISVKPFFIFLLPFFYVFHGYIEFIGFASFKSLVPLLFIYLGNITLLWLMLVPLFKSWIKAALMCMALAGYYLFFGAIFDFLKAYSPWPFLYKYSVLLVLGAVTMLCLVVYLRKKTFAPRKPVLFLNLLFLLYILFDLSQAFYLYNRNTTLYWKGAVNQANGIIHDTVHKPDIYLLVFDGYCSTYGLRKVFGFNNSAFDSAIIKRHFKIAPNSRSNYSTTSFSMASTFNMDYLYWLDATKLIKKKDYAMSTTQIHNNKVMDFLVNNGYEIVNHSIFDIKGHPSSVDNPWRTVYSNIISEGTLGMRMVIQFRWWIIGTPIINKLLPFLIYENDEVNNKNSLQNVKHESSSKRNKPRFVYGHFLMPHNPYFRDKHGAPRPQEEFDNVSWFEGPNNYYTEYLQYTNQEILKLIDTIKANTKEQAVIILMSDHGYHYVAPVEKQKFIWNNLNAWYLPEKAQATQFHGSITNVNQFRILFNTLFHQQFPIMNDSFMRTYDR